MVSFEGTINSGITVSITVTGNDLVAVFPALSVAEHSTVVVPIGNTNPDWGEQETVT